MSLTRHYTLALALALAFASAPEAVLDFSDRVGSSGEGIHSGYGPAAEPGGEGAGTGPRPSELG